MIAITWTTFFSCDWCEVWFIWNKQKQQSKWYTWTESGPKNVLRPNRSDVGPERSRTRTWTCTNTNPNPIPNPKLTSSYAGGLFMYASCRPLRPLNSTVKWNMAHVQMSMSPAPLYRQTHDVTHWLNLFRSQACHHKPALKDCWWPHVIISSSNGLTCTVWVKKKQPLNFFGDIFT